MFRVRVVNGRYPTGQWALSDAYWHVRGGNIAILAPELCSSFSNADNNRKCNGGKWLYWKLLYLCTLIKWSSTNQLNMSDTNFLSQRRETAGEKPEYMYCVTDIDTWIFQVYGTSDILFEGSSVLTMCQISLWTYSTVEIHNLACYSFFLKA